ncbi:MAG: hypothetical protein IJ820_07305 [Lachnospiraceae bacterium]|nr:hypothetical protein [Lachnospiraceae bacterium]
MKKMMITAALAVAATMALSFGAMASEDTKVEAGGLVFEIPAQYKDLVTVETEGLEAGELIRVSETASMDAAKAMGEEENGAGWLFSISGIQENELGKLRCSDMSGREVFAEDEDVYYMFNHPTDVRLLRETNEEMDEAMDQWTALNEWANGEVRDAVLADNPRLEKEICSNTELDMYLARARYDGLKYKIRSLEIGEMDPTVFGEDDFLDEMTEDVSFEEVTDLSDAEQPDGEYIVMAFDDENVRFDFFLGEGLENYIREVKTTDDGEEVETLYRAIFEDPEESATGIMREAIASMAHTDDDEGIDD